MSSLSRDSTSERGGALRQSLGSAWNTRSPMHTRSADESPARAPRTRREDIGAFRRGSAPARTDPRHNSRPRHAPRAASFGGGGALVLWAPGTEPRAAPRRPAWRNATRTRERESRLPFPAVSTKVLFSTHRTRSGHFHGRQTSSRSPGQRPRHHSFTPRLPNPPISLERT